MRQVPSSGYVVPGFSWDGFYVGALAGYGSGTQRLDRINRGGTAVAVPSGSETSLAGGSFGGLIGFNNHIGNIVFGLEADLSWSAVKGSQSLSGVGPVLPLTTTLTSYGTARGRLGYAFDRVMPYVTGGLYWASSEANTGLAGAGQIKTKSNDVGWTLGGGVEVALDRHWSIKAEYLYAKADLNYNLVNSLGQQGGFGLDAVAETSTHQNILRGGVNYRF